MNTKYTPFVFSVAIIIIYNMCNVSFAQEKNYYEGKYSFQFQIGPNFTLNTFQGSVLSGKYNFSNNNAVRVGLTISANNQSQNHLHEQINPAANASSIVETDMNSYGIILQYIRNNYLENNLNFYYGGGPSFAYGSNSLSNLNQPGFVTLNSDYKRTYGIIACAGIEWYFMKSMSLSAQYGINYNYYEEVMRNTAVVNDTQQSSDEVKTNGFQIIPNSVLFGLSIYF